MSRCRTYPFVHPLRGCGNTRGDAIGYRYASPDGDGFPVTYSVTHSHTDHSSLITDHSSHTFSAKEKDSETGLSYFGARYYSSDLSIWLSVDPQASKYPSLSPYVYCANNPIKLVDPNGEEWETTEDAEFAQKLITIAQDRQKLYKPESKEYKLLQEGINVLNFMGNEEGQKYTFSKSSTSEGNVSLLDNGTISINYVERGDIEDSKNGSAWHEAFHLTRRNEWKKQGFEERSMASTSYWGFKNNKLGNNNRANEEYVTYTSQLIFSPQSMPESNGIKVDNDSSIKDYIRKNYKCPSNHSFQFPNP